MSSLFLELEGVLIDTRATRRDSLAEALAAEGITVSARALAEGDGYPVPLAVDRALAHAAGAPGRPASVDATTRELVTLRAERAFGAQLAHGVTLAPGAAAFVAGARGRARLALVTRALRREAEFALALAGFEDAFDVVVARDDLGVTVPDPAPLRHAAARLASRHVPSFGRTGAQARARQIALQDGLPGIRAARAAALHVVAVGPLALPDALEADALLPSLAGILPDALEALLDPARDPSMAHDPDHRS